MTAFMLMLFCLAVICLIAHRGHRFVAANEGEETTPDFRGLVLEMLGLPAETDDAGITSAVEEFRKAAKNEEPPADPPPPEKTEEEKKMEAANARLTTQLAAANEAAANAQIDLAIAEGRIVAGDRENWAGQFKADYNKAANELQKLSKTELPKQTIGDMSKRKPAAANARERASTIQAAVNERMANGMTYDQAYAAVEKDPAYAAIFGAMAKPAHQEAV